MINDILDDGGKLVFVTMCFMILSELIVAFVLFNNTKNFVANSRTVKTKVVKLEPDGELAKAYINFKDPLGNTVDTSIRVLPSEYKVDQEIEVLSHKENPGKLMLSSSINIYLKFFPRGLLASAISTGGLLGLLVFWDIAKSPF